MLHLTLEPVFDAVRREEMYARGWGRPRPEAPAKDDHVSRTDFPNVPWSLADWVVFAEKYLLEAKLAYANYTGDRRVIAVRLLKAAYLLLAAIETNLTEQEIATIGGVSSTAFPFQNRGLLGFLDEMAKQEAK